jgi:hypothetical protein
MKLTPELIIKKCAEYFGVPESEIISPSRKGEFITARHTAMYLMREFIKVDSKDWRRPNKIKMTYKAIIDLFPATSKNHSSVIAAIKEISNRITYDKKYRAIYSELAKQLGIIPIEDKDPGMPFMANDYFTAEEINRTNPVAEVREPYVPLQRESSGPSITVGFMPFMGYKVHATN